MVPPPNDADMKDPNPVHVTEAPSSTTAMPGTSMDSAKPLSGSSPRRPCKRTSSGTTGGNAEAAARIAGLSTVPALVLDRALAPEKSLETQLVENLHREGLDPIDEAEAYAALRGMGAKVSAIARRVGKERTYVSHSMRLLRLHPKVREMVRSGLIERNHALTLLRLEPEQ